MLLLKNQMSTSAHSQWQQDTASNSLRTRNFTIAASVRQSAHQQPMARSLQGRTVRNVSREGRRPSIPAPSAPAHATAGGMTNFAQRSS